MRTRSVPPVVPPPPYRAALAAKFVEKVSTPAEATLRFPLSLPNPALPPLPPASPESTSLIPAASAFWKIATS